MKHSHESYHLKTRQNFKTHIHIKSNFRLFSKLAHLKLSMDLVFGLSLCKLNLCSYFE